MTLKVKKLVPFATLPSKAYSGDMGFDLYSSEDCQILPSGQIAVGTGIALEMPEGWGGVLKDRSSMASKKIYLSAGVIDNGYRGEVKAVLRNQSEKPFHIARGDKIAQMIPIPIVDWQILEEPDLQETKRNSGGFGSSGK